MHCILAPLGKPKAEIGTEYPDLVCGAKAPFFPQSLPRFHPSDRRICAKRKEHPHLHSAVSASGIFTPFLCALRQKKRKAVFRNMPIFCFRRISSTEIQLSPFSNHLSRACGINNSFGIIIFCETHILFFVASICLLFQFISCNTVFIINPPYAQKNSKSPFAPDRFPRLPCAKSQRG